MFRETPNRDFAPGSFGQDGLTSNEQIEHGLKIDDATSTNRELLGKKALKLGIIDESQLDLVTRAADEFNFTQRGDLDTAIELYSKIAEVHYRDELLTDMDVIGNTLSDDVDIHLQALRARRKSFKTMEEMG